MERARQSKGDARALRQCKTIFFFVALSSLARAYACCFVTRKTFRRNSAVTTTAGCRSAVRPVRADWRINARRGCYMSKSLHEGIGISEWEKEGREYAAAVPANYLFSTSYMSFFFFSFFCQRTRLASCNYGAIIHSSIASRWEYLITITWTYSTRNACHF